MDLKLADQTRIYYNTDYKRSISVTIHTQMNVFSHFLSTYVLLERVRNRGAITHSSGHGNSLTACNLQFQVLEDEA